MFFMTAQQQVQRVQLSFGANVGSSNPVGTLQIINANNVTNNATIFAAAFIQNAGSGTTNLGFLNTSGATVITTNNVVGQINVGSLTLTVNTGRLTGTIGGIGGVLAVTQVVLTHSVNFGALFINGVDVGLAVSGVVNVVSVVATSAIYIPSAPMSMSGSLSGSFSSGFAPIAGPTGLFGGEAGGGLINMGSSGSTSGGSSGGSNAQGGGSQSSGSQGGSSNNASGSSSTSTSSDANTGSNSGTDSQSSGTTSGTNSQSTDTKRKTKNSSSTPKNASGR